MFQHPSCDYLRTMKLLFCTIALCLQSWMCTLLRKQHDFCCPSHKSSLCLWEMKRRVHFVCVFGLVANLIFRTRITKTRPVNIVVDSTCKCTCDGRFCGGVSQYISRFGIKRGLTTTVITFTSYLNQPCLTWLNFNLVSLYLGQPITHLPLPLSSALLPFRQLVYESYHLVNM